MSKRIHGIALAPGVSRNNRLYTKPMIAEACTKLQARIASGENPVVMRTHHGAGDDSLRVVGVVEAVSLTTDGALAYDTRMASTQTAADIAALAESQDNKAAVKVSVYGNWTGKVRMVEHEGRFVETADGIDIDKIDFTATPGVLGTSAIVTEYVPSDDPNVISESVRPVRFVDESPITESSLDAESGGYLCVSVSGYVNGFDLAIGAWGVPAADIDAYSDTAQRAIAAAVAILQAGPVDDDGDGESASDDAMETKTTDTEAVTETKKEEAEMADTKKAVTETADPQETANLAETIQSAVAAGVVEALKAAGVVKESAEEEKPVAETVEETKPVDMAELKESLKQELLGELVKERAVTPTRKGFRVTETDEDEAGADWANRGEDFAKAFGLIPEDPAPAGA